MPNELAGLCALLGNQQSHNVYLTNLQVVELQSAAAAQELATEKQVAAAVQANIDEKVAEGLMKDAPSDLPAQAIQPDKKNNDGDGDLPSSRSGHSSQGARRRAKHAERSQHRLAYQEAYEIANGAATQPASEFDGTRGYSSEADTRGTRSAISGLRTLLQQARGRLQSRDHLVEEVLERARTTRTPRRQEASAVPQGNGGHTKATTASALFSRQMAPGPNRAGSRCDLPAPKQSPVSRSCSLSEEMPSSVGAGPSSIRGGSMAMGTKRRVGFDIKVGSNASGSKPKRVDVPVIGYKAMQT